VLLGQQVARTFPTGPYVVTKRFEDLPKRRYGLISADPAWQFGTWDHATAVTARGTKEHYKTQTLEEIAAVPVGSIATTVRLPPNRRPRARRRTPGRKSRASALAGFRRKTEVM
jgi:hypothetical protein